MRLNKGAQQGAGTTSPARAAQGRPAHASLGYRTPAEPFADELPDLQA